MRRDSSREEAVLGAIRAEEVVELLAAMTRVNSVDGNETEVARLIAARLQEAGIPYRIEEVEPGRGNLLFGLGPEEGRPRLLFSAHLDTVPAGDRANWSRDPFGAEIADGRIYGRGVSDDKGGAAGMAMATIALARAGVALSGRLEVTLVMGEETGNRGTRRLVEQGLAGDAAIVGEWSGAGRIGLGYRGLLWLEVTTHGRTSHGARPQMGVSAIDHMTEIVLPALKRVRLPFDPNPVFMIPEPTVGVGTIAGGVATNVVPDRCTAALDYRLPPGQQTADLLAAIDAALEELRAGNPALRVERRVQAAAEPFYTPREAPLVRSLADAIERVTGREPDYFGKSGSSDGNVLAELGIPTVAYAPGNTTGHQPDEYIELEDLLQSTRVYALAAMAICGIHRD